MKITKQDLKVLKKHFKELIRSDGVDGGGITSSDARMTIVSWLYDIGEKEIGSEFEDEMIDYALKVE